MLRKETLTFLKEVANNNNREWFVANKHLYDEAREDVLQMVAELIKALAAIDPMIDAETDPKKSVMRIYRDVRFSKNKDPYKKNFGIWFSAKGKGGNEPGYYVHIHPGASFVAGGYWMPEAEHLKLIRQEIDYNTNEFLDALEVATKKSMSLNFENSLKTSPKGYEVDDPNIKYLRLKSFEVSEKIADKDWLDAGIVNKLKSYFESIYPLVAFLRNTLNQ